jgi:hypothetical protein
MAAGVTEHVWDMAEIAALITAQEAPDASRAPYKKKAAYESIVSRCVLHRLGSDVGFLVFDGKICGRSNAHFRLLGFLGQHEKLPSAMSRQ